VKKDFFSFFSTMIVIAVVACAGNTLSIYGVLDVFIRFQVLVL
jgi:hypothetical protein